MPSDQEDAGRPDPEDRVELIDAFHAMWNTHQAEGVLSFFTEDAVFTVVGLLNDSSVSYRGKWAIEMVQIYLPSWQALARGHFPAAPDRVMWMERTSADWLCRLGVGWLEWNAEVVLRKGKITALTLTLTPESVEKLETAMRDRH
jgi:hypothetical protein